MQDIGTELFFTDLPLVHPLHELPVGTNSALPRRRRVEQAAVMVNGRIFRISQGSAALRPYQTVLDWDD